jgi:hypothetical protein
MKPIISRNLTPIPVFYRQTRRGAGPAPSILFHENENCCIIPNWVMGFASKSCSQVSKDNFCYWLIRMMKDGSRNFLFCDNDLAKLACILQKYLFLNLVMKVAESNNDLSIYS